MLLKKKAKGQSFTALFLIKNVDLLTKQICSFLSGLAIHGKVLGVFIQYVHTLKNCKLITLSVIFNIEL